MLRRLVVLALLGVATFIACTRAPPEPAAAAETRAAAGPCIRPLSASAPAEQKAVPPEKCPRDPDFTSPLKTADLVIPEGDGGTLKLVAELARTSDEHSKGLMYRTTMAEDHGMLFVMERKVQNFWMENTCIPLDMVFIDGDGTIVGIVEQAAPLTRDERSVGCPSSYVLEVKGGFARRHGLRPGKKLALPKL